MNIKISLLVILFLGVIGFIVGQIFLAKPRIDRESLRLKYEETVNHHPEIIEVINESNEVEKPLTKLCAFDPFGPA